MERKVELSQHTPAFVEFYEALLAHSGTIFAAYRGLQQNVEDEMYDDQEIDLIQEYIERTAINRAVDEFQSYLAGLLLRIYQKHPASIGSRKIDQSVLLEHDDIESLRRRVVEDYVLATMYQNVLEISDDLNKKLNFSLFKGRLTRLKIRRIVEIRNLIAHNRCVVNRRFIAVCGHRKDKLGEIVRIPDAKYITNTLRNVALDIDLAAVDKFGVFE